MKIKDLSRVLQIFTKYGDEDTFLYAGHDVLYISTVMPEHIDPLDLANLEELGATWDKEGWIAYL